MCRQARITVTIPSQDPSSWFGLQRCLPNTRSLLQVLDANWQHRQAVQNEPLARKQRQKASKDRVRDKGAPGCAAVCTSDPLPPHTHNRGVASCLSRGKSRILILQVSYYRAGLEHWPEQVESLTTRVHASPFHAGVVAPLRREAPSHTGVEPPPE